MKDFNETRPENITSDGIWELYKTIRSMDTPYIKTKASGDDREYLYLVESSELHVEETRYDFDCWAGIDIPVDRPEGIKMSLKRYLCDDEITRKSFVHINGCACSDLEMNPGEIMYHNGISFPTEAELGKADLVCGIPATYIEEKPKHRTRPIRRCYSVENRLDNFRSYLDGKDIWYTLDSDNGAQRITMAFEAPDCPGGWSEICIWFYKNCAEVRCYYSEAGSEIFKKSAHKYELLRLLNFINARVHLDQNDGYNEPQMFLEPRFYVTEDSGCDITATTMINYHIWDKVYEFDTGEYITGYCPELLNILAPFVFAVLKGEMTADEAIEGIRSDILKDE